MAQLDRLYHFVGLTNERGNVCGLMSHPERAVDPLLGGADGQKVFASVFKSLVQI